MLTAGCCHSGVAYVNGGGVFIQVLHMLTVACCHSGVVC